MPKSSENRRLVQENTFSKEFLKLISVANVETNVDSLNVFLHACMLDVGFLPKNVEEQEVYNCMPDGWKMTGAWKFLYYHKSCPDLFCWMTCIPFYSFIAIQSSLENGNSQSNICLNLKTSDYLKDDVEHDVVEKIFKNTRQLERKFKDKFSFPLLAVLQESVGCAPTFGFCAAVDEVKMYILQLLPVQSVVAMSLVNKDCNRIVNSPYLWKHLLVRDFGLVDDRSVSTEENYKELYIREYTKRKRRVRTVFPTPQSRHILPHYPPSYIDPRIDLDPALQQAFPSLRDRIRPNPLLPPYNFPGWFM